MNSTNPLDSSKNVDTCDKKPDETNYEYLYRLLINTNIARKSPHCNIPDAVLDSIVYDAIQESPQGVWEILHHLANNKEDLEIMSDYNVLFLHRIVCPMVIHIVTCNNAIPISYQLADKIDIIDLILEFLLLDDDEFIVPIQQFIINFTRYTNNADNCDEANTDRDILSRVINTKLMNLLNEFYNSLNINTNNRNFTNNTGYNVDQSRILFARIRSVLQFTCKDKSILDGNVRLSSRIQFDYITAVHYFYFFQHIICYMYYDEGTNAEVSDQERFRLVAKGGVFFCQVINQIIEQHQHLIMILMGLPSQSYTSQSKQIQHDVNCTANEERDNNDMSQLIFYSSYADELELTNIMVIQDHIDALNDHMQMSQHINTYKYDYSHQYKEQHQLWLDLLNNILNFLSTPFCYEDHILTQMALDEDLCPDTTIRLIQLVFETHINLSLEHLSTNTYIQQQECFLPLLSQHTILAVLQWISNAHYHVTRGPLEPEPGNVISSSQLYQLQSCNGDDIPMVQDAQHDDVADRVNLFLHPVVYDDLITSMLWLQEFSFNELIQQQLALYIPSLSTQLLYTYLIQIPTESDDADVYKSKSNVNNIDITTEKIIIYLLTLMIFYPPTILKTKAQSSCAFKIDIQLVLEYFVNTYTSSSVMTGDLGRVLLEYKE